MYVYIYTYRYLVAAFVLAAGWGSIAESTLRNDI